MALTQGQILDNAVTYIAGEALTKGYIVEETTTDGTVQLAKTKASDLMVGVVIETAASGANVKVAKLGDWVYAYAGSTGAITSGACVTCHTDGTAIATTTTGDNYVGFARNTTTTAGEYVLVEIIPGVYYA